jgi:spore coat polysaccharide biosynthesis protein SpsF
MVLAVVIQARLGSTRLPGKVLADVAGHPLLHHVVNRASAIEGIDELVVAIPDSSRDDDLAKEAARLGVRVVRGSEMDVLDRYVRAIEAVNADVVIRVTADCPLLSPTISSRVVEVFRTPTEHYDYASNTLERTYPRGLDTEVISADALRVAGREAQSEAEREHVTPFIWRRPSRFSLGSESATVDLSAERWTVDTEEDLEFVRAVYAQFGGQDFDHLDVMDLLHRKPDLRALNAAVEQKEILR